jgi:hypothetical protein
VVPQDSGDVPAREPASQVAGYRTAQHVP